MSLSRTRIASSIFVLSAFAMTACGGRGVTPPFAGQVSHGATLISNAVEETTVPNVAGTYKGTFTVTSGGHSGSGTYSQVISQSGSAISGTISETIMRKTNTFNFSGTVAKAKVGAKLKFTIFGQNGSNGASHASVVGKQELGKVYVPPSGKNPAVYITFKGTKQ